MRKTENNIASPIENNEDYKEYQLIIKDIESNKNMSNNVKKQVVGLLAFLLMALASGVAFDKTFNNNSIPISATTVVGTAIFSGFITYGVSDKIAIIRNLKSKRNNLEDKLVQIQETHVLRLLPKEKETNFNS